MSSLCLLPNQKFLARSNLPSLNRLFVWASSRGARCSVRFSSRCSKCTPSDNATSAMFLCWVLTKQPSLSLSLHVFWVFVLWSHLKTRLLKISTLDRTCSLLHHQGLSPRMSRLGMATEKEDCMDLYLIFWVGLAYQPERINDDYCAGHSGCFKLRWKSV